MGLYRRGNIFWFTISQEGKRIQISTRTNNRKLAQRICAKAITEVQEGRWFEGVKGKSITVPELLDRYCKEREKTRARNTILRDKTLKKHIAGYFGQYSLANVTPDICNEYRQHRYEQGKAPATVNRELTLLRNAYNVAIRTYKWCAKNPVSETKFDRENNSRDRWLTVDEESRLLNSLEGRYREIVIIALYTGMRQDEVLSLKWHQIDLSRRTIVILESKNKEKRTIPVNQTVCDLLMEKRKVRHISNYFFPSQAGTKIHASKITRAFVKARKKAGIENFRFHDLRHTFATRLAQAGVDLYKISKLLGHRDITTTQRYAHHYPESLRSSVEVLDSATILLQSGERKMGYVT